MACTSKFLRVRARQHFKKKLPSKNLTPPPPTERGGVEPFPHEKGKYFLKFLIYLKIYSQVN